LFPSGASRLPVFCVSGATAVKGKSCGPMGKKRGEMPMTQTPPPFKKTAKKGGKKR
jgi:hypothetical protein